MKISSATALKEAIQKANNLQALAALPKLSEVVRQYLDPEFVKEFDELYQEKNQECLQALEKKIAELWQQSEQAGTNMLDLTRSYLSLRPALDLAEAQGERYKERILLIDKLSNLEIPPDARKEISKGFYLDKFFWHCLRAAIETANAVDIPILAKGCKPIEEEILQAQFDADELRFAACQYNETLETFAKRLVKIKLNPNQALGLRMTGIVLSEQKKGLVGLEALYLRFDQLVDKITSANQQALRKKAKELKQALEHVGNKYVHAAIRLEDLISQMVSHLRGAYHDLAGLSKEWNVLLNDIFIDILSVQMSRAFKQELKKKFKAIHEAKTLSDLFVLSTTIPDAVKNQELAAWRRGLAVLSEGKTAELKPILELELKAIEQAAEKSDWDAAAKFYLYSQDDFKAAKLPTIKLKQLLRQARAAEKITHQETAKQLDLVLNSVVPESLDIQIKEAHTDEELNDCAAIFFAVKEGVQAHQALAVQQVNAIAKLILAKTSGRPSPEKRFEALSRFCDKDNFPGFEAPRPVEPPAPPRPPRDPSALWPPEPPKAQEIPARVQTLAALQAYIAVMNAKRKDLEERHEYDAVAAVDVLFARMTRAKLAFTTNNIGLSAYKILVRGALSDAHIELDKHRGWKQLLLNLALAVLTLGIGYLLVAACQGRLFPALPVATSSKKALGELELGVENLSEGLKV